MPKELIQKAAKITGSLIAISGITFVLYKLGISWQLLVEKTEPLTIVIPLLFLSLVYGISQLLISRGWHILLLTYQKTDIPFLLAHKINARTQIAKYLPSNVLHHAGRLSLGKLHGIDSTALIKASMDEILLLVASAALLSSIFFLSTNTPWQGITGQYIDAIMLSLFALIMIRLAVHILSYRKNNKTSLPVIARRLTFSGLHYLLFILSSAIINTLLANELLNFSNWDQTLTFTAVFLLAWLIGFLTPGAPGGIGVREAILVMALSSTYNEAGLLLTAVASRIISIVGDIAFFGLSFPDSQSIKQKK